MKHKNTKTPMEKKAGGAREGAGRKSADELGVEKKQGYRAYLYPSQYQQLLKYFPNLTVVAEWALEQKTKTNDQGK